ncbi:unnamed protein product [Dracunculus medinensis]|uniref:EF-hand domain-containing protein n=1 Tax=Dracunculus medinensis TaxID=318479 RepID=A0A0N4UEC1_DRAME|nr:unnamed protein product [Dracunculus medinensis]
MTVISRIFTGAVIRNSINKEITTLKYSDFIYFILAEVDKNHPTSIEYWFRVMDLDGDGRLSMDELQYFYNGILEKLIKAQVEVMSFCDVICLLIDIIKPQSEIYITLGDIKKSSMSTYFFNTFINWVKYYIQECNDSNQKVFSYSKNN